MAVLVPFIFNISPSSTIIPFLALGGYATFYASTWEEFHTGTLFLDYISGPVEGAWAVVISALISSIFGPQFWQMALFDAIKLKSIVPFVFILGSISSILTSIRHVNKRSLVIQGFLLPAAYFVSCVLLIFAIPSNLYFWFIFVTGFPACLRISSTILAYITKSPLKSQTFYPIEYLPTLLLISKHLLPINFWIQLFKLSVFLSATIYLYTMLLIISDISSYLNIFCLTIKQK